MLRSKCNAYILNADIDESCYKISYIHSNPVTMITQNKSPIFDDFIEVQKQRSIQ